MAPDPWINVPQNPEYFRDSILVGELLDVKAIDDSGGTQGNFVAIVEDVPLAKSSATRTARCA